MKKNIPFGIFLLFILSLNSLMAQDKVQANAMSFDKITHDFGQIPQGTPVTTIFTFKNTGKTPVIVSSVQASCGCTTPTYTKEPVAHKQAGSITATYNAGSVGDFNKTISVISNTGSPVTLTLKGTVTAAPATGQAAGNSK